MSICLPACNNSETEWISKFGMGMYTNSKSCRSELKPDTVGFEVLTAVSMKMAVL
jgi:hypothetical protein